MDNETLTKLREAAGLEAARDIDYGDVDPTKAAATRVLGREPTEAEWAAYRHEYALTVQHLSGMQPVDHTAALKTLLAAATAVAGYVQTSAGNACERTEREVGDLRAALLEARTLAMLSLELSEPDWVLFTKRTDDPKLGHLERLLTAHEIPHRRRGQSFHAPILEVRRADLDAAWRLLDPIDDLPDDHPSFGADV